MKIRIQHTFFLLLLLTVSLSRAQNYPVQAFVQLSPPYSSYLPDYADPFNNQLKIILTLTDYAVPSYQVKLRFSIDGQGYSMQSADLVNFQSITLTPGVPVEISGSDLAPYLATQNLVFNGLSAAQYENSKILPEGPATICVEVVDINSANQPVIGNPACTQSWFSMFDPPLLNTPMCGTEVTVTTPQQIVFSWSPLHMVSPQSGQTTYEFELFEMRPDNNQDPNQVVNASLPIYTTTTTNTTINYGIVEPQLNVGMSYVWRIKAIDPSGRALYRNGGYSAVCTFTYGNAADQLLDGIELVLESEGTGTRQGNAWWNAEGVIDSYVLEVRKTGNANYQWFPYPTTDAQIKVNSLEPETEYECRVKGIVGSTETDWSNTSTFTTFPKPNYACGSNALPASSSQITPLEFLMPSDYVQVGQFEMQVTSAQPVGPPGHFEGTGKINIPFMLLNLNVQFDDILIDDNMMVREGRVDAMTQGVDEWMANQETIFVNGHISDIQTNTQDSVITVYLDGGDTLSFDWPENDPLVIQDDSGLIYTINPDGTIVVSGAFTFDEDNLVATKDHQIEFIKAPDQEYGFDGLEYMEWAGNYPSIQLQDGSVYTATYKSVGSNESDVVRAIFHIDPDTSINYDPVFVASSSKNGAGSNLPSTKINDTTYEITVSNFMTSKYIYALDPVGGKLGRCNLSVYASKDYDVKIIPVNGATAPDINALQASIDSTFKQAYTFLTLALADTFSYSFDGNNNGLDYPDDGGLSKYSSEMKALRDAYFEANSKENNTYYLFVVPEMETTANNQHLAGYMVRGKAVGFLENGVNNKAYAHELAHGAFGLKHTFPQIDQGTTNNLLDYGSGTHLTHEQWYDMQHFNPSFSILDDEEDGGMASLTTNSYSEIFELLNADSTITFLSPAGKPITLEGNISQLKFITYEDKWLYNGEPVEGSYAPMGALASFEVDGKLYSGKGQFEGALFKGYYCSEIDEWYIDSLSSESNYLPVIVIPSYSMLGFEGSAFHINSSTDQLAPVLGYKSEGTVASRWGFMPYVTKDSILTGVDVHPNFSFEFSIQTEALLSDLLFSNSIEGNQSNDLFEGDYNLYDFEYSVPTQNPFEQGSLEKYIGPEALLVYQAAYLIESVPSADNCFASLEQVISSGIHSQLFGEYYNQLNQEANGSNSNDEIFSSTDSPVMIVPHDAPDFLISMPETDLEYKKRRLKEIIGGIKFYNQLISSFDHNEELNDLESEMIVGLMDYLSNQSEELGNCLMKLVNPATKIKLMTRTLNSSWSDDKEELIVRVIENTTDEQFEEMWPALTSGDCFLFNALISDLWFSHYDRFMNNLSWHVLKIQQKQPTYNQNNLPIYTLFEDGLNPLDSETEFELNGCDVSFEGQLNGMLTVSQQTFKAWDIVKFVAAERFEFPSFQGEFVEEGDTIIAPAIWAYYFLDEHGQHANTEAFSYFITTVFIIATEGAGAPVLIELSALGASYAMHIVADENPDIEELEDISTAVDYLTLLTVFTPTKLANLNLAKIPWISKSLENSKNIYRFVKSEFSDYVKLLRSDIKVLDDAILKLNKIINQLNNSSLGQGAKQQFLQYMLYARLNLKIAKYGKEINKARVAASNLKLEVEIHEQIDNFTSGTTFDLADITPTSVEGELTLSNPRLYNPSNTNHGNVEDHLQSLFDVKIIDETGSSTKSYNVVYTSTNQVYLKEIHWSDELLSNWSQSKRNDLITDLSDQTLNGLFINAPPSQKIKLAEAWKIVRESIGNTTNNGFTQFAVDPKTLEKVSEMMQPGSGLRNKFPNTWEQKLSDILSANKDIGCATCGSSGITRVPPMDEMLDNVEHIMQYGNKPGFNTIMTNLKSNVHNRDGIHHMITYMKNNPSEFANVIEFEFRYADDIMNKADVLVGNVKYEFKSWTPDIPNPWNSFFSGSGDSYTQMIRYFENSTNLNQVKYVFNSSKATETQVKNAFKDLFLSKSDEIFEANQELFKQFQKIGGGKIENLDDFETLLNHETFSIDHPMFNFIKCP